jgi:putative ABC transport system permease protein
MKPSKRPNSPDYVQFHPKYLFTRAWQTAVIALRALRRNKLRSTLTALGIIIGVASVVAMVAVGNGAQARITNQVAALGQNLLSIFAGSRKSGGVNSGLGSASALTLQDAEAIGREVTDVVAISPEDSTTAQAIANGRNWSTTVAGESPDYLKIRDWKLASGSMFTDREVRSAAKVAVIGSKTANELFGPLNPVGQSVRVQNIPFVIIGLLESKGAGMGGQNQDDRILIPYSTAMKRLTGDKFLRSVNVQIGSADRMEIAEQQITSLLRQRHRLTAGRDDDFNIFNQKEIADTVSSISKIITLLLGSVAGISLFVGGIGIMNIMLVSVTERTREIGIRIAVGAQPGDIRLQFLIEAVTLSLLGGLIGVLCGVGASRLLEVVADFKAIVSTGSILLAFGVSSVIGIFFGFYPAHKAASSWTFSRHPSGLAVKIPDSRT